jgi:nucleoid-associated protein YgaU
LCVNFLTTKNASSAAASLRGAFNAGLLLLAFVISSAARCSAQDLAELARQELARKAAKPTHPVHVYTNDDLVRAHILAPEDKAEFATSLPESESAIGEQRPVEEESNPDLSSVVTPGITSGVESDTTAEVSLGEIARQYRKQKLSRQSMAATQPQDLRTPLAPVSTTPRPSTQAPSIRAPKIQTVVRAHVYTNDDMVRPKILTPSDRIVFEASLKRAVSDVKQAGSNSSSTDSVVSEISLGDIARLAYRQHMYETQRAVDAQRPARFRFPETWAALASPTPRIRPATGRRRTVVFARRITIHSREQNSADLRDDGFGFVRVRRGDSLWKLAQVYLGDSSRWRVLLKANPWIKNPNYLKAGREIRTRPTGSFSLQHSSQREKR